MLPQIWIAEFKKAWRFGKTSVVSNYVVSAESMGISKPEIRLSKVVPVVNNEIEIRLETNTLIKDDATFSIVYEGKDILKEKISPVDGKVSKKWIPKETGFYTASFDLGGNIGKVSFEFPVVWREFYFTVWPPLSKEESKYRYLSSYIILHGEKGSGHGEEMIPFWKSRGSKTLNCTNGMQVIDMGISEEEAIKKAVAHWSTPMKKGFDGIFMDEFGEYPLPELLKKVDRAGKALMQLRKENPDMLIFPAAGGAQLREETISYKYSDSVALIETYDTCFSRYFESHSFKKHLDYRIEIARNTDLIAEYGHDRKHKKHGAIILLGLNGCDIFHEEPSIPQTEEQVRYIKKNAPEMPGIAFYTAGLVVPWMKDAGIYEACENLILDYYIKPVVDIREIWFSDYSPVFGKELEIFVNVHNLGGMDAKDVKVQIYVSEFGRDNKRKIDEIIIKKIGTGYMELKKTTKDKPYEYQEVNGNRYVVFDKYNTIFLSRTTIRTLLRPEKKGYYTIIAEVESSDNYTVLDGIMKKDILVK